MMEQPIIVNLLMSCVVVAGFNVPVNSTAETGLSTQNPFINGLGGDFSDEKISSVFYFTCTNGQAVLRTFLCNGRDDCGDNSDEIDSSCTVNTPRATCPQYTCPSGKCIHYTDVCDGFNDCGDNSDEQSCHLRIPRQICSGHTCPSGKCLLSSDICDGFNDCGDHSDESGCVNSQCVGHTCPSGKCILYSDLCDGNHDCEDGSDESDCFSTYSSTDTYSYAHVASGVGVPGCVMICVGCCCCGVRRRRMQATTRTTRATIATAAGRRRMQTTSRTSRTPAANTTVSTITVAGDLPPSYAQAVRSSAAGQGAANPACAHSA